MKNKLLFKILIFAQSAYFFADDQQIFNQAQNKFSQEKWNVALDDYQRIQDKNSMVWQNIGICLLQTQQYPQALVAVKRAMRDATFKQLNVLENLEKQIYIELHVQPCSDLYFFLRKILFFIPLLILQIIFLILLIQIFLMLLRRWRWHDFTQQEKRFLKKLVIILWVCIGLWYLKTLSFLDDKAIVINSNVVVYAGPDETFHDFEKLPPGTEVKIIEKQEKMYHIKTSKFLGWVKKDTLELINNYE